MTPSPKPLAPSGPPRGLQVRSGLSSAELAAVAELAAAAAEADGVAPLSEHVLLHQRYAGPVSALDLLLREPGGELVGYAHLDGTVAPEAGTVPSAELVVHPRARCRGHGRALVEAVLAAVDEAESAGRGAPGQGETERGAGAAAGAERLRIWAHGQLPAAAALAAALGLERVRTLLRLGRPFPVVPPLPDLSPPAGIVLRTFRPGHDEAAWLALNARAFADHPEQGSWTRADLALREREAWFDPAGFFLAERRPAAGAARGEPQLLGFHWTKVHAEQPGSEPLGEIYVLGIDPAAQGLGLGTLLAVAGLRYLEQRGMPGVQLYVEADNVAALRLYQRLGFTRWSADVMFAARRPARSAR